ncbi:alpha/beta hydrolase [Alteromonas ponticola]|uniref:Alpha/beta hydrolase n=1 Tax=Alteromonas aquimaris TaxID=2998417 RepID=A0ABT3P8S4_9ALTE|nr:alpha/beta hydrolase [Alteromonas aquimaris]MCW8109158.1 alpha/beta hydrolase [Alteromonas aquimaris]
MSVQRRNNVKVMGKGTETIVFAHGFGCDQNMWKYLVPSYEDRYKIVLFDLVGSGKSDLSAYDFDKYASLQGFANDLIEIIEEFSDGPVIFVGHSVSATIGMLASVDHPDKFKCQIMVGPSPSYINDGDYIGGFSQADIDELCNMIDSNYLGWASNMAPAIMGPPDQPELAEELENSFCRTDPAIAKHFARVTFLSDHRDAVAKSQPPALILQCSDDFIAPRTVGEYMLQNMPDAKMVIIENVGHCPHLSAPHASIDAIDEFLNERFM